MNYKIKVAFYRLASKQNKKGLAPVYARIKRQGAKVVNISTELWFLPNEWDEKKKKPKGSSSRVAVMAKQLRDFEDRIYRTVRDIEYDNKEVTPEEIKLRLADEKVQYTLMALFEYYIGDKKKREGHGVKKRNIQAYITTQNKIVEFLKQPQYRCADISLERLDYNFIVGFSAFLAKTYQNRVSTIHKDTQRLCTVISTGIKLGWLATNPFAAYKGKTCYQKRQYLTEQELECIAKFDSTTNNYLEITRDLFLFMSYTGISYIDLYSLTLENIVPGETGRPVIQFDRMKTGTICTVPTNKFILSIIEKYKTHPTCLNRGSLLPVFSNQTLNKYLKQIAENVAIKKPVTCHVARHTFATLALNNWNVPIKVVSKILGHRSIKTTMIYLQITQVKIEKDCTTMIEMIDSKYSPSRIA